MSGRYCGYLSWTRAVKSPPSFDPKYRIELFRIDLLTFSKELTSRIMFRACPSLKPVKLCSTAKMKDFSDVHITSKKMRHWLHQRYSSSVSPFHAQTGTPVAAIAAAAWSCVEKMLQDVHATLAPSAVRVSIYVKRLAKMGTKEVLGMYKNSGLNGHVLEAAWVVPFFFLGASVKNRPSIPQCERLSRAALCHTVDKNIFLLLYAVWIYAMIYNLPSFSDSSSQAS